MTHQCHHVVGKLVCQARSRVPIGDKGHKPVLTGMTLGGDDDETFRGMDLQSLQMSGGYVELRKGLPYNGLDTVGAFFMHPNIVAVIGPGGYLFGQLAWFNVATALHLLQNGLKVTHIN